MEEQKPSFFEKVEKIKLPFRILIFVGTIVLLAGAFTWFVYLDKSEQIEETQKKNRELSKKLAGVKKKAKNLNKFEEKYKTANAQLTEALKILPNSKEIPSLLTNITQLGEESGLQFLVFNPQSDRGKGFYVEIPVSIRVEGAYHDVLSFFDKVGHMDRIVNILNVSMRPKQNLSTQLITNCEAVTFQFRPQSDKDTEETKKGKKKGKKGKKGK
jgi:type IV pilus assembly protein PilO